ncbi:Pentatricopeptide repeat-containing protein [Arachis hypogaea]|nr:Pentatricopeptide repeat-containing protein [Arachis hypogaea]
MVEELLWMGRKMKEDGLEPSLYNFNSLMNGLVNAGMVESTVRVFEAMREFNVRPDLVCYNMVVKGYCKVSYMTVMQACYGEGDVDCCVRLYHEMKEKGLVVPPYAYSFVVCELCRQGKVVEGLNVFEEMRRDSCGANKAVYTAFIDGYAKTRNVDGAIRLFERMRQEGIKPDEVTYGAIVNGLCKGGRVEEALGYLEFCKENGVVVNAVFYSSLIDGLGKAGRVDEAEKLIDEALVLFKWMEEEGCEQTVYTYTVLISELFKVHRNEEALKLWDMMIDKGITPNVACFRALSIGLCLSGKVARACKILDELAPMRIVLETAYEDMINVLCKAGRVKEACKLADGIVDRCREISGKVRTLMINALSKVGNADLAIWLMHSKIGIGYCTFKIDNGQSLYMYGSIAMPDCCVVSELNRLLIPETIIN